MTQEKGYNILNFSRVKKIVNVFVYPCICSKKVQENDNIIVYSVKALKSERDFFFDFQNFPHYNHIAV